MSHRWNCPTDYEIRQRARDDAEYGAPRDRWSEDCPESQDRYRREFYRAEEAIEEERLERRQQAHREQRRADEQEAEAEYYRQEQYEREDERWLQQMDEEYHAAQTAAYYAHLAAEDTPKFLSAYADSFTD